MRSVMLSAMLLATVAVASEQEPSSEAVERTTFVGLVPVPLGRGLLAIDGEHALGSRLSARMGVRIGAGLFKENGNTVTQGDLSTLTLGVEPGLRYYLTGTALDGPWLGTHLELSRMTYDTQINTGIGQARGHSRVWSAGVGALVGYSMVVSRGLTVQAGVGLGASYGSSLMTFHDGANPDQPPEFQSDSRSWGISERATLAVGWAF